ncbi:MAG: ABC transporter ATP-binding protein/permease [Oscillospiraceae bacterium]|nr:ABC transporter ATP-binding protein/permease [Oscillospiraceae bacterium]
MANSKNSPQAEVPAIGRQNHIGGGPARFMPKERAKNARGTFLRLLKFYTKEAKSLFFVSILLLINAAASVFAPYLIGKSVDAMTAAGGVNFTLIYQYGAALLMIYVTVWLLNITQGLIMNAASQRIMRTLHGTLFDKMQRLPLMYHDTHTHGELMSRLTNDIDNISGTIAQSTTELISASVTILGSVVMMLALSPVLTLVSMMTVPLVLLLTKLISKRSREMFAGQQRELGRLNGLIEESISGRKIVLAFNMRGKVIKSFGENNARMTAYSVKAQIWSGLLMPFMNVITNLGYVSVMFTGGMLAVNNPLLIGTVASFGTYSRQFAFPLNNIAGMYNNLQAALAGAERVFEVLDESDEPEDIPGAIDIGIPKGEVEFRNVSFAYVPGSDVLKGVSFKVSPGQKVALVGETGAGKTTIVNLLTRFYDVTGGEVLIDGRDIKSYKRDSLRNAFSVVLQDTCLFTGSIADNIRYAVPEATQEEIENASALADADTFIKRLKNGYETQVSGETDALSQGQRQLLAISRAVLCRAPILILDEATSSVDTRTELKIQQALMRLAKGRTTFVIAHRLSTIRDADVIMVVKDSGIAEHGSHEELIALGGVYKAMFESQIQSGIRSAE